MLSFSRGVRIPHYKEPAASRDIRTFSPKEPVLAPLSYGESETSLPAAAAGAVVHKGEVLSVPCSEDALPACATVSGTFTDIRTISHPVFGSVSCAVLTPLAEETAVKAAPQPQEDAVDAARAAGIIDELDGIPLYLKLEEWRGGGVDVLVADASEAEPYSSSAWAVLNESAEEIYKGLAMAADSAGASRHHIAVLLPASRRRPLMQRLGDDAVFQVRGRYPVDKLTDAPARAAVRRIGVQACLALYRAVTLGQAQTDCVLTVAGDAVANPQNVRVPFGTSIAEILTACGLSSDPQYVVCGDAMTGVTADSLDTPIFPGITCLLALATRQVPRQRPCMGCGRCTRACHKDLLPYEIVRRLENMHYERLRTLCPEECDGCGACSHVCPAGRDVTAKVLEAKQTQGTIFLHWGDDDDA